MWEARCSTSLPPAQGSPPWLPWLQTRMLVSSSEVAPSVQAAGYTAPLRVTPRENREERQAQQMPRLPVMWTLRGPQRQKAVGSLAELASAAGPSHCCMGPGG